VFGWIHVIKLSKHSGVYCTVKVAKIRSLFTYVITQQPYNTVYLSMFNAVKECGVVLV